MTALIDPDLLASRQAQAQALLDGLDHIILGQQHLTRLVLTTILAGGHVLLEGLPGLGKTELVKALSTLCGLQHSRIQFTPDLLPADITGTQVIDRETGGMHFRRGPLFTQILLADEINRASPKTQSALLEAMAEAHVTTFDTTYPLPQPFFVLATQNPIEQDGTYPLPEAQLDRFTCKLQVTGIDTPTLGALIRQRPDGHYPLPAPVCTAADIGVLIAAARAIVLPEAVAAFIARLVNASRPELAEAPELVRAHVRWGASPRAAIALACCGRARALLEGRPAVGFADVQALAPAVLGHRIICSYEAALQGITSAAVVAELLTSVSELAT